MEMCLGIIIGLIAAYSYNKFSETNLPMALSFFSGKRLVPIMTAFFLYNFSDYFIIDLASSL